MELRNLLIQNIETDVAKVRKQQIMFMLKNSVKPLTDQEIRYRLGYNDPNCVRPRRNELVKEGLVKACGKRECSITHKIVETWWYV